MYSMWADNIYGCRMYHVLLRFSSKMALSQSKKALQPLATIFYLKDPIMFYSISCTAADSTHTYCGSLGLSSQTLVQTETGC